MILNYFDSVKDGIEFIIAVGSILGVLGLISTVIICLFSSSSRTRRYMFPTILTCLILIILCGWDTGFRYFRIRL